ncbi:hypothetical protein Neosp_005499 [[Neocosmospora] mangrovei]
MAPAPSGAAVLGTIYTLIVLAALVIAARIYLRIVIQKRRLLASDFIMTLAWLSAVSTSAFDILLKKHRALEAHINYTLTNYEAKSEEEFEHVLKEPEEMCPEGDLKLVFEVAWALHFTGSLAQLWSALDVYVGLIIACLPSLRPYLRRNFGASYQYDYNESGRVTKSTVTRRPGQSGFEELGEGPYAGPSTGGSRAIASRHAAESAEFSTDGDDDKKSNRSDIELVNINVGANGKERAHA